MAPWPRGGGKSTTLETAAVAWGSRRRRRFVLVVRETQKQANESVRNISSKLDGEAFGGEGLALAGEVGVEVETVTDIDDDEEGRPAVIRGQRPSVAVGLVLGALHGLLPLPGAPPGRACFAPLPGSAEGCGRASAGPPYDVSGWERVSRRREPEGDVCGAGDDRAGLDRRATLFFGYSGSHKKRMCWFISGCGLPRRRWARRRPCLTFG